VRAFVLSVVWIAGCGFPHGSLSRGDAPPPGDGDIDAELDAIDGPPDADTNVCSTVGLSCPGGMVAMAACNGACWVKCTLPGMITQPMAASACTAWAGKLAPVRTLADQNCVAVTLFPTQASWIGFEQANNAATVSAGWSWNSDGVTSSYTNWDTAGNQPDDANNNENGAEQCAFLPTTGLWHDADCGGGLYRFSCRR
jgi:hypothetical protein